MPSNPFVLVLTATLAASASGTVTYPVPNTERLTIKAILQASTGIFSITDIRNGGGIHFGNMATANPLTSALIQDTESPNLGFSQFLGLIEIRGGDQLIIDLVDTSAAPNVVRLLLICEKELGVT